MKLLTWYSCAELSHNIKMFDEITCINMLSSIALDFHNSVLLLTGEEKTYYDQLVNHYIVTPISQYETITVDI